MTLYVVGTPIGNLADLSERAREVFGRVESVLAEDTRRTRGLLTHLGVSGKAVIRLDAHATPERIERLVERLVAGAELALATDAGTPGVSDPGALLVRAAHERGVRVVPIPGASAVTAAIAASGLVGGPFLFLAFLPRSGKKRRLLLERVARSEEPVVLFEAPSRIAGTLAELAALDPERRAVVCRELTKLHEELRAGTLAELAAEQRQWLGEVTLVVAGYEGPRDEPHADPTEVAAELVERLRSGAHPRELSAELARRLGIPRREAYQRVLAAREGFKTPRAP